MQIKYFIKRFIRDFLFDIGIISRPNPFHLSNLYNLKYYFLSLKRDAELAKGDVVCLMCTWMEEIVAPLAIESTKDFVSRYVIVDKGVGDTVDVIKKCSDEWNLDVDIYVKPELNLRESRAFALEKISEPWVLVQDGDMVFHTDGPLAIANLRKFMDRSNILLSCPMNTLWEDFLSRRNDYVRMGAHPILYHNNGTLRAPDIQHDLPVMDGWMINLGKPYAFNCLVKSPKRMFLRGFWRKWWDSQMYEKYPNIEDYVTQELNIDVECEAKKYHTDLKLRLLPYDEKKWGYYPKVIRNFIEKSKIYRGARNL